MNPMKIAAVAAATMLFSGSMQAQMANHGMEMKADKNIVEVATGAGFNTLVAAVKAAGLVDALSGKGPFTVFAPTDAAFAKLPAGTVESLLEPQNKEKLKEILLLHVVPAKFYAKDVTTISEAKTAGGNHLFKQGCWTILGVVKGLIKHFHHCQFNVQSNHVAKRKRPDGMITAQAHACIDFLCACQAFLQGENRLVNHRAK